MLHPGWLCNDEEKENQEEEQKRTTNLKLMQITQMKWQSENN